jgi:hypothetical protein
VTRKAKDRTLVKLESVVVLPPSGSKVHPCAEIRNRFLVGGIAPLELQFREATSRNDRKRALRNWVLHFMQECEAAGATTEIPMLLLAMEELRDEGLPIYDGERLRIIGVALLASEARRKAKDPETGRNYTKAKADAWTWAKLPSRDRTLFDPKERTDRKPDSRRIEKWRRLLRHHLSGRADEFFIRHSWLDLNVAVRGLRSLHSPPAPTSSWEDAASRIVSGDLSLWEPLAFTLKRLTSLGTARAPRLSSDDLKRRP